MQSSKAMPNDQWDQLILGEHYKPDEDYKADYWRNWQPIYPTLIVIDYLYLYRDALDALLRRCTTLNNAQDLHHPVRILLIDHVFPENLKNVLNHTVTAKIFSTIDITVPCYRPTPLQLTTLYKENTRGKDECVNDPNMDKLIQSILEDVAGSNVGPEKKKQAQDYLKNTTTAYYPLFAILLGYTLKHNPDAAFGSWSRRKLIEQYFSKSHRLPWLRKEKEAHWASACIAAATARREIPFKLLEDCMRDEANVPLVNFNIVRKHCHTVISQPANGHTLKPYEPDILGENFFLLFIHDLLNGQENLRPIHQAFFKMMSNGDKETQQKSALEFVDFIKRLLRNLSNDNQTDSTVQSHWDTLSSFLDTSIFKENALITWAISVALVEARKAYLDIDNTAPKQKFHSPNPKILCTNNEALLPDTLFYIGLNMEIYLRHNEVELQNWHHETIKFCQFYNLNYENKTTALHMACRRQHRTLASILIQNKLDINSRDKYGYTPLILSANLGDIDIVNLLLKQKDIEIDAQDLSGNTSLMAACFQNKSEVAQTLLNHDADTEKYDLKHRTALTIACLFGHKHIALSLLNHKANINNKDFRNMTPLMHACSNACKDIVLILLKQENLDVNAHNKKFRTALMYACEVGDYEIVKLLLDRNALKEVYDKSGKTPAMYASQNGYTTIVNDFF